MREQLLPLLDQPGELGSVVMVHGRFTKQSSGGLEWGPQFRGACGQLRRRLRQHSGLR